MPLPAIGFKTAPLAGERGDKLRPSPPSTDVARPTLGVYWRTLRHLRGSQLGYLAARRLWPRSSAPRRVAGPVALAKLERLPNFPEWQPAAAREMIRTRRFNFLHTTNPPGEVIPWSPGPSPATEVPRLWRYHLNYCDFLNVDLARPDDEPDLRSALAITLDWLDRNRAGSEVGWEPYPLSLRIANWLKFLVRNRAPIEGLGGSTGARSALDRVVASVAEQAATLEGRLECDLGANHLLKNIKALLFAGALLETAESDRRWTTSAGLLEQQLREQILPDGGHFERSPMYHLQVLEDLLDLRSLSEACGRTLGCNTLLEERITAMAAFTRAILHPDGEIPLFNDSAFGGARPARELLSLATASLPTEAAQASSTDSPPVNSRLTVLAESGYAVIRDADSGSCLIFDCGPLGPDYNPAHGHCDVLSYELSLHGQRVVTDSGVSTYERGPERQYERSTAAHNTVRVDGEEQAEVWASFRVGRRPRVGPITGEETQGYQVVRGKHFGYQHRGVVHSRAIIHTPEKAWVIVDSLTGSGEHQIESFIHFHPAVAVAPERDGENAGQEGVRAQFGVEFGGHRYRLMTLGPGDVALGESSYSPEFGRRERRRVISWTAKENVPKKFVCLLVPEESRSPVIRCGRENAIEIDGAQLVVN